jgi:hypothetical protein
MTQPRTPGDAISVAAERIRIARQAAKDLSQEIADKRAQEAQAQQPSTQDDAS